VAASEAVATSVLMPCRLFGAAAPFRLGGFWELIITMFALAAVAILVTIVMAFVFVLVSAAALWGAYTRAATGVSTTAAGIMDDDD
jgi:hypothetical protein